MFVGADLVDVHTITSIIDWRCRMACFIIDHSGTDTFTLCFLIDPEFKDYLMPVILRTHSSQIIVHLQSLLL